EAAAMARTSLRIRSMTSSLVRIVPKPANGAGQSARQYLLRHMFYQQSGHLHGVERRSLAQVVGGQPEVELLIFVDAMAYTTNIDHVLPHCVANGRRISVRLDQLDALGRLQGRVDRRQVDRAAALQRHTEAIAEKHR